MQNLCSAVMPLRDHRGAGEQVSRIANRKQ